MKEIFGNIKDLKHIQLKAIRALYSSHVGTEDLVGASLARRLCGAAFLSRRFVAVLVDRKGAIRFVIVGDSARLYLPDIGRVRGGQDRLRGLRLIVARPNPLNIKILDDSRRKIVSLAHDFKTDLEKLRLDAVVEIDASRENAEGPLILGHLAKVKSKENRTIIASKEVVYNSVHQVTQPFPQFIQALNEDLDKASQGGKQVNKASNKCLDDAILIGVYNTGKTEGHASMTELRELAKSARVNVVDEVIQWRPKSNPKTVVGVGKLEEICLHALSLGIELLIFDCDLTPSQLLHITDLTDLKILDRTMLILDIFSQRAVTREGKLQVEMAQLDYSLPRLAKKQSGLSRLTGGIGGRGPGETKLEVNRRRVKERIARLNNELSKIQKQRELRRQVRQVNEVPTLAIVGYTNAGKSTLLNRLSNSKIYAKDELFATLDPHSRRLRFPYEQEVLITDTVGFISNLPKTLMRAFMATLEELTHADVLIHVVDIADVNYRQQIQVVEDVLQELSLADKSKLLVFNKIDLLPQEDLLAEKERNRGVFVSAEKKIGFTELISACSKACRASLNPNAQNKSINEVHAPGLEVFFDGREKP